MPLVQNRGNPLPKRRFLGMTDQYDAAPKRLAPIDPSRSPIWPLCRSSLCLVHARYPARSGPARAGVLFAVASLCVAEN